jgi:hypothetical protein
MDIEELINKLSLSERCEKLQITFDNEITFGLRRKNIKGIVTIGDKAIIDYGKTETPITVGNFLEMLYNIQDKDLEVGVLSRNHFVEVKEVLYIGGMFSNMTIIQFC